MEEEREEEEKEEEEREGGADDVSCKSVMGCGGLSEELCGDCGSFEIVVWEGRG